MGYLFDSNILIRLVHRNHPDHAVIRNAVRNLKVMGETGHYTSQNLGEFWNVTTRPASARGGACQSPVAAHRAARVLERVAILLPDTPEVHAEWRRMLVTYSISGVQVHDARLAAAMSVHGLTHILTLNDGDFGRYQYITAVHPKNV